MAFKVAGRPVFGSGGYQVFSPTAGGGGGVPLETFLTFALGRHMGNWR
jgi:hypothetical protein